MGRNKVNTGTYEVKRRTNEYGIPMKMKGRWSATFFNKILSTRKMHNDWARDTMGLSPSNKIMWITKIQTCESAKDWFALPWKHNRSRQNQLLRRNKTSEILGEEENQPMHIIFIDLEKAHDAKAANFEYNIPWLRRKCIPTEYIEITTKNYSTKVSHK